MMRVNFKWSIDTETFEDLKAFRSIAPRPQTIKTMEVHNCSVFNAICLYHFLTKLSAFTCFLTHDQGLRFNKVLLVSLGFYKPFKCSGFYFLFWYTPLGRGGGEKIESWKGGQTKTNHYKGGGWIFFHVCISSNSNPTPTKVLVNTP